jgi:hypothetical protein
MARDPVASINRPKKRPTRPLTGQAAVDARVPEGWVRFEANDDPRQTVLVEERGARRTIQGYALWEEVDRRGDTSLTSFAGYKPIGRDIQVLLDGFAAGTGVTAATQMLEALAGRGPRAVGIEPPKLRVTDESGLWVINDIQWSDDPDDVIKDDGGLFLRNAATVSIREYVADDRLQDRALAAKRRIDAKKKGARRRYTVKQGDTLISIARHRLGDPGRWVEIARLNGLRDPRAVRPGAVIRLP